jgi:hypothetical protein
MEREKGGHGREGGPHEHSPGIGAADAHGG